MMAPWIDQYKIITLLLIDPTLKFLKKNKLLIKRERDGNFFLADFFYLESLGIFATFLPGIDFLVLEKCRNLVVYFYSLLASVLFNSSAGKKKVQNGW